MAQTVSFTGQFNGRPAFSYHVIGRRAGFTSSTVFNDVKEFDNNVAAIPVLNNSTLDVLSSSASDTNAGGTGVRKVRVTYINAANNLVESPNINLNGLTLVTSVLIGVNEILWMEASEVGSALVAVGNIRLRLNGSVVEVEQISLGNTRSMTARFMVPVGFTGYITAWRGSAVNNDQDLRLLATVNSFDRTLSPVFKAQASLNLPTNMSATCFENQFIKIPALARLKIATMSATTGAAVEVETNLFLITVQDPP